MNPARFLALILPFAASGLSAQNVSILSYKYLIGPTQGTETGMYLDTNHTKLKDGVAVVPAWTPGGTLSEVSAFVGWNNLHETAEIITFNFAEGTTINSATFYFADSDGAAGVALPYELWLDTNDGFSRVLTIDDPEGSGSTVAFTLSGFEVTTNQLMLSIGNSGGWHMMTEASFTGASAIPEPSTYAALAGALALGVVVWRRRVTAIAKR